VNYHDHEWGRPLKNDRKLFEMLILEGFQAGLSWITILKKRENFRKAFCNFNPQKISNFKANDVRRLLRNEGIIRNRLKINGAIVNARAYLQIKKEFPSFTDYIWQFTDHKSLRVRRRTPLDVPTRSTESDHMSKDLKKRGFKFVGTTICYAFMQAVGMVNDHVDGCFMNKRKP
jgi:DNA-3-methyladenine glycosylase I